MYSLLFTIANLGILLGNIGVSIGECGHKLNNWATYQIQARLDKEYDYLSKGGD